MNSETFFIGCGGDLVRRKTMTKEHQELATSAKQTKKREMKYTVRKSIIEVVGKIWMPSVTCAMPYTLSDYDVENCRDDDGKITRESVEQWLCAHAGDFQSITDFSASIEDGETTVEIPFATEEGELAWCDCMYHE